MNPISPLRLSPLFGFLPLLVLLALSTEPASAQVFGRPELYEGTNVRYFTFVERGRPATQVQVWGAVGTPGLYEVAVGTDIATLLTLSGGPPIGVRQPETRREVTVRLYRAGATGIDGSGEVPRAVEGGAPDLSDLLVYEASLEEMIAGRGNYPVLQDGDILFVESLERTRIGWREAIGVAQVVGTLIILALNLSDRIR